MNKKNQLKNILAGLIIVLPLILSVWVYKRYYTRPVGEYSIKEAVGSYQLTTESTLWEILHGVIAFGKDTHILNTEDNIQVNAVDFICTQRQIFTGDGARQVIELIDRYPYFIRTDNSGLVQGHPAQFVSKLISAKAGLDQKIDLLTKQYTLKNMVEAIMISIDLNKIKDTPAMGSRHYRDYELGWILELLSNSIAEDTVWQTKYADRVSLEKLIEVALMRPVGWGSCGGTHELSALAVCLKNHKTRKGEIKGIWKELSGMLDQAKDIARAKINSDGSYDRRWTPVSVPPFYIDRWKFVNEKIYMTGHMLAWLVICADDDELQEPFIKKAYEFLVRLKIRKEDVISDYGAFTHALEAIKLYEERVGKLR